MPKKLIKSNKRQAINPVILWSSFAIVIALLFLALGKSYIFNENVKLNQTPASVSFPTITNINEEAKDGVYTNYTYGFKMEYPENVFNKVDRAWDPYTDKWFYVEGQRTPKLIVGNYDHPDNVEYYQEFYEKCRNADVGEILSRTAKSGTSMKLYNTDIACVTHSTPEGLEDGEPSYGYGAIVKSPTNELFYISLGELDLVKLQALRDEFDRIVKSFEFIAIRS